MRVALAVVTLLNLLSILGLWAMATLRHPLPTPANLALTGFSLLSMAAPLYVGIRRRLQRGRNAGARLGFHVGVVDVIEGLTGEEMSRGAQTKTQLVVAGVAVVLVGALVTSTLLHRLR